MKIGILTFHAAFNYGSMLQAWALQTALNDLGHEVKIINFQSPRQKRMYRKPFASMNPVYLLGDLNRVRKFGKEYIGRRSRWDKFNEFLCRHMKLTDEYDAESWYDKEKDFDVIVTGSDQIWNLSTYDFDEAYLGKGIGSNINLVAYAPSLGPFPEKNDKGILTYYLKKYSHISTREESAKHYLLSSNICHSIEKVLDPTMLLDVKRYVPFIEDTLSIKTPYAYYYTPGNHPNILAMAISLCDELQLPLKVDFGFFNTKASRDISVIADAGPCEFLSYIYHSQVVIGASFHLIVFAILMHKEFFCINGDVDERLNSLLSMLSLKERLVSLKSEIPKKIKPINWAEVDAKLRMFRDKSYRFLTESLSK